MIIDYLNIYNSKVEQARKIKPSYKDCKIINKLYRWLCVENALRTEIAKMQQEKI